MLRLGGSGLRVPLRAPLRVCLGAIRVSFRATVGVTIKAAVRVTIQGVWGYYIRHSHSLGFRLGLYKRVVVFGSFWGFHWFSQGSTLLVFAKASRGLQDLAGFTVWFLVGNG